MIWHFDELPTNEQKKVGGKAATLARLYQAGYPVPNGFIISSGTFVNGNLADWSGVEMALGRLWNDDGHFDLAPQKRFPVAVRSSARSEDSANASYAGEFERVLNCSTFDEIKKAIQTVYNSQFSSRVAAYQETVDSLPASEQDESALAIIVQQMVPAEVAGVLFTADPVSGSHVEMVGNFVHGLGEKLVAGEVNAESFVLQRPSGTYNGPATFKPYAKRLYNLANQLTQLLGSQQDIEWAVAAGKLVLLQARPITTLQHYNPVNGEWNDSLRGDYLWSNANFGEAIPGVMTPLTWSVIQIYAEETFGNPLPGNDPMMGNIGGRFYVNLSLFSAMFQALGFSRERINRESEEFFGNLPADITIPTIPFSRLTVLRRFIPFALRAATRRLRNLRQLAAFTAELPQQISALHVAVETAVSPTELAQFWQDDIEPLLRQAYQMLQAGTSRYENAYRPLHHQLVEQVGETDANLLLSGVSNAGEQLASLGPLVGLWEVSQDKLSRDDYLKQYGHRGPHEFELSWPRPAEDPDWLDTQLATLGDVDVPGLLAKQAAQKQAAWQRYAARFPKEVDKTEKKLIAAADAARGREAVRSEVTRLLGLVRFFALRAGELTQLDDRIFYLWLNELLAVLNGGDADLAQISIRQAAHVRFSALPAYPGLINGRFDPTIWAADPHKRFDIFDTHANASEQAKNLNQISGYPGSSGSVEGIVRRLDSPEEGHLLQPGEILVTNSTNIGWSPIFPRAAAIVTDVGAPLSHAAIVARELGIPAVVGCGDATMRLFTGDRVRVNGGKGEITFC